MLYIIVFNVAQLQQEIITISSCYALDHLFGALNCIQLLLALLLLMSDYKILSRPSSSFSPTFEWSVEGARAVWHSKSVGRPNREYITAAVLYLLNHFITAYSLFKIARRAWHEECS